MEWIIAYFIVGGLLAEAAKDSNTTTQAHPFSSYILCLFAWGVVLPLIVLTKWITGK